MKKFLMGLLITLTSITVNAAGGDKVINFYVDTATGSLMSSENGTDVEHVDGTIANYSITIGKLEFSETDCQCAMKVEANGNHNWDEFHIYRMKSLYSDEYVDVEQHAQEDPEWNAYEVYDTHIWFQDTFLKSWVDSDDLCYEVHDSRNNHLLTIVIHHAFGHNIITNIEVIISNGPVIYYDLQGHSSTKPFKGVNIIKINNSTKKAIY